MEDEFLSDDIAFHMDELAVMIKQYRLEDFGEALMKSVALINRMIDFGVIESTKEGIMKGMEFIVGANPEIDDSFRRFAQAVFDKTLDEMKQMEKPN